MAHEEPRHLVLRQEHRLEASRCEEEAGNFERQGWLCVFFTLEAQRFEDKVRVLAAGTFVAAPKYWELEWV